MKYIKENYAKLNAQEADLLRKEIKNERELRKALFIPPLPDAIESALKVRYERPSGAQSLNEYVTTNQWEQWPSFFVRRTSSQNEQQQNVIVPKTLAGNGR